MENRIPLPERLGASFLDAGGVLIIPDTARVSELVGIEHERDTMLDAFAHANDLLNQPEGDDFLRHAWLWQQCFEKLGDASTPARQAYIVSVRDGSYNPFIPVTAAPGVHEALKKLDSFAESIVVVSNANGTIEHALQAGGICQVGQGTGLSIKAVVDSTTVGVDKPKPEIFKIALDKAGVSVNEAVHVGDSLFSDMEGARRAGIAGIHIDRLRRCTDQSHFHAFDLGEAVDLLSVGR